MVKVEDLGIYLKWMYGCGIEKGEVSVYLWCVCIYVFMGVWGGGGGENFIIWRRKLEIFGSLF